MPGIEVLDDALDRSALSAGVATFEEDEQSGADLAGAELPPEVEAQLKQPALGDLDASLVLPPPQPLREVELVESRRHAHRSRCYARARTASRAALAAASSASVGMARLGVVTIARTASMGSFGDRSSRTRPLLSWRVSVSCV